MFCGRCGSSVPSNASFCPRCGKSIVVVLQHPAVPTAEHVPNSSLDSAIAKQDAARDSLNKQENTVAVADSQQSQSTEAPEGAVTMVGVHTPLPVPEPKGAGKGRYVLVTALAVIFGILLGSTLFTFLSEMDSNAEKAGETLGKSIVPLIFWIGMIVLAWRAIKSREPESRFLRRHRRFGTATSIMVSVLATAGIALGIWNSHRIKVADEIRQLTEANADLQKKGTEFRQHLYEIRHRDVPTMRQYYDQCMDLEKLLNDYEPTRERGPLVIQRIRQILPSADQSSTAMLNGMDDILRLDDQIMRDLRQEIAYSKVLITLPARQQSAFYRESILPVQDHENSLIAEEVKKLKELRSMGVQFPTDVLQKID